MFKKLHEKLDMITESIRKVEEKNNALDMMVAKYEREVNRLSRQNKTLMDRLMARDFEQLQIYQTTPAESPGREVAPDEDIFNAGEVLDLEAKY